jgi:dihydrolipoamide dehydrogenase
VPGAAETIVGAIDVDAALGRRDEMTSGWDDSGQLPWLEEKGVALIRGSARLLRERELVVVDGAGIEHAVNARRAVVLATGSSASVPPIPGLADVGAWDNRDATAAKEVPERLIALGGGAVGLELAQAFRRLGSREVTVVEASERLLPREEPFAGEQVAGALVSEGISVITGIPVVAVGRSGREVTATLGDGRSVTADEVLVAVGRRARTAELGLETVGLVAGRYVEVDDQLRAVDVPNGWLYAVGDVNGRALLTHMGKYQARIAADVIAGHDAHDRASASVVPRVTFTDPQVAAVGLTEAQARDRYPSVRSVGYGTGDVTGAYTSGVGITGTSQLVIDTERSVVVGATFTGPGIAELLHAATIAIAAEVPLEQLWHAVPSFPTISEVWLRLLEAYGL